VSSETVLCFDTVSQLSRFPLHTPLPSSVAVRLEPPLDALEGILLAFARALPGSTEAGLKKLALSQIWKAKVH
jgi:hypothetical protein